MNIYFVHFKVIPIRYTLIPYTYTNVIFLIFEAHQKIIFLKVCSSIFDAVFDLVNRSPFTGLFSFGNKKKSHGARSGCGQKAAHKQRFVSNAVVMQKPIFVFPQIRAFLADCFEQIANNLQVIFLIDRPRNRRKL